MRSVSSIERDIALIEHFDVRFLSTDGIDPSLQRVPSYPYATAANRRWTVAKWRDTRFVRNYPEYSVEVLDGDGKVAHGKTLLSTVRASYEFTLPHEDDDAEVNEAPWEPEPEDEGELDVVSTSASRVPGNRTASDIERREPLGFEATLWEAADHLRANSKLKASEYSNPVLGLIFLYYADRRFKEAADRIEGRASKRQTIGPVNYHAEGVAYIPESARFGRLLTLPEQENLGKALNDAMAKIEADNPDLRGVLPRAYTKIDNATLVELLKLLNGMPKSLDGDALGLIYEYFLGEFAKAEGQKGGEFFTPTSVVRLIVEIIEPYHGKILDPACGSGGMFVQSARFVERHAKAPGAEISLYGQERIEETVRLARMNLAIHGLSGEIREGNTYYEDLHSSIGRFDFVMANPPFNVDKIDKTKLEGDRRFPYGLPRADNGNYIWIQAFYSALNDHGRAGFVMANSAGDAAGSESAIRRKLIEDGCVDIVVSIGSKFFYTVTLPVTLWFLDKAKRWGNRADNVLFIDARKIYHQIDRAHRDFEPRQIEFLANIVRLYRGETPEVSADSAELMAQHFPDDSYLDVGGLCRVASVAEIEAQAWSLNPGRYVGTTAEDEENAEEFLEQLTGLYKEFRNLSAEAETLRTEVEATIEGILAG